MTAAATDIAHDTPPIKKCRLDKTEWESSVNVDAFRAAFCDGQKEYVDATGARVFGNAAFPVGVISSIFDDAFARQIKNELLARPFAQKHNDLYDFMQSGDLNGVSASQSPALARLHGVISSDAFTNWMNALTGIELISGRVDLAGQRYLQGGHLLCHDDDIADADCGRRIAFILYLVPPDGEGGWADSDGGQLELYTA
jgi:hypothetical protein